MPLRMPTSGDPLISQWLPSQCSINECPFPPTIFCPPSAQPTPPRYVEYASFIPLSKNLVTKPSGPPPANDDWMGSSLGKLAEYVRPVTYTLLLESVAIP